MKKLAFIIIACISFGMPTSASTMTKGAVTEMTSDSGDQKQGVTAKSGEYKGYFNVTNNNNYTVKVTCTIYGHTKNGKVNAGTTSQTLPPHYHYIPAASVWSDDIISYSIKIVTVQRVNE